MGRIEGCVVFQLGRAYQQVNQEARRRLADCRTVCAIEVLWETDGQSGALGERLRLDGAAMTGRLPFFFRSRVVDLGRARVVAARGAAVAKVPTGVDPALRPARHKTSAAVWAAVRDRPATTWPR